MWNCIKPGIKFHPNRIYGYSHNAITLLIKFIYIYIFFLSEKNDKCIFYSTITIANFKLTSFCTHFCYFIYTIWIKYKLLLIIKMIWRYYISMFYTWRLYNINDELSVLLNTYKKIDWQFSRMSTVLNHRK